VLLFNIQGNPADIFDVTNQTGGGYAAGQIIWCEIFLSSMHCPPARLAWFPMGCTLDGMPRTRRLEEHCIGIIAVVLLYCMAGNVQHGSQTRAIAAFRS